MLFNNMCLGNSIHFEKKVFEGEHKQIRRVSPVCIIRSFIYMLKSFHFILQII